MHNTDTDTPAPIRATTPDALPIGARVSRYRLDEPSGTVVAHNRGGSVTIAWDHGGTHSGPASHGLWVHPVAEVVEAEVEAPRPIRVGLVGCAAAKLQRPAAARDLYTSQLFRKAAAYAESTCDVWFILSAEHGLVHPDTVLAPYDTKLGTKTGPPIWDWAARVQAQLDDELQGLDVVIVALAGEQYRTALHRSPRPVEVPMQGLGIGQQLGFLTAALAA